MITADLLAPRASREIQLGAARILLVDDDALVRQCMRMMLARAGYAVTTASNVSEAINLLAGADFDVLLSDVHMPGQSGLEFLAHVRKERPGLPVILVTGAASLPDAVQALESGAVRYLPKPVEPKLLCATVEEAFRKARVAQASHRALEQAGASDYLARPLEIESGFQRALSSLWMAYQPIVSWSTRSLFAYEALVRTAEPTIPHPGALFAAAETLGALVNVGRKIRQSVAGLLAERDDVCVFVNLHAQDLLDEELFLTGSALAPFGERVVLEITERADFGKHKDLPERLAKLRQFGFAIAIDDLGAGYAGLTSWIDLEPEIVKLDMSLIRNLHTHKTKRSLVGSLIRICSESNTKVIAEGVELEQERDALADLGCDLMQGYLFGKPARELSLPKL